MTTTGTLEDREAEAQRAVRRRRPRSPTPPRPSSTTTATTSSGSATSASSSSRCSRGTPPEYPCLIGGIVNAGKLQAEAFRGFTLHIVLETLPNQPRAYTPADPPALRRRPRARTASTCPTRRGLRQPVRQQPDFNDGVDEPTGKGTARVAPNGTSAPALAGQPPARPRCSARARADARGQRRPTYPTSACCCRPDGPRGGGDAAMKLLDKTTTGDLVKLLIFIVVTTLATGGAGGHDRQHLLRAQARLQGDVRRRHRRRQGRRHPDRRRQGRQRQGRRDRRPHPRPGHLHRRGHDDAQQGDARRDPLPQPGRPALHLADRRDRRHRRARGRATRSRSARPRRRST